MNPLEICKRLGPKRIDGIIGELNSNQLKTTLRHGDLTVKVPSRIVSQKARRRLWGERIQAAMANENELIADSLLYEWLLYHRRPMLMEYLDAIGVKHQGGETEETFTKTVPAETLVKAAEELARRRDAAEVAAYVLYLDHHQESNVFSAVESILAMFAPQEPGGPPASDE